MAVEEFPHLDAALLFPRQYQLSLYRTTERKKSPKLVSTQQHLAEQPSLDKSLSSHRAITIVS